MFVGFFLFRLRFGGKAEFSNKVKYNVHFLKPFPIHLFRRMDNDFLDKLINDCRCQFRYSHVLADNGGEAVKIAFVLLTGIDFLLFGFYLFRQFFLWLSR